MTLIERAARALESHLITGTIRKGEYEDAVLVVLQAIREPTDLMGAILAVMPREPDKAGNHCATEIWRGMIDGAIKEAGLSVATSFRSNQPALDQPQAKECCAGGPQWGHAWDCPICP